MIILRNKKNISIILYFILDKFNCLPNISKEIIEKDEGNLKGTFSINSIYKEKSFLSCVDNKLNFLISKFFISKKNGYLS